MFNDYFAQQVILKIQSNEVGFGSKFDVSKYATLRLHAQNKTSENYNENLVNFYDDLSKYVLTFLENNSKIIRVWGYNMVIRNRLSINIHHLEI